MEGKIRRNGYRAPRKIYYYLHLTPDWLPLQNGENQWQSSEKVYLNGLKYFSTQINKGGFNATVIIVIHFEKSQFTTETKIRKSRTYLQTGSHMKFRENIWVKTQGASFKKKKSPQWLVIASTES